MNQNLVTRFDFDSVSACDLLDATIFAMTRNSCLGGDLSVSQFSANTNARKLDNKSSSLKADCLGRYVYPEKRELV